MSVSLKSTYVYMFTSIVIFAVYGWWVFGVLGVEYFTGEDALVRIGRALSILIVAGYAFEILTVLSWSVFNSVVLKHKKEDFVVDQRDRQITYKSIYNSHFVLCAGIFIAIGAMAMGWSAFWVFNLMVLGFALSVLMELGSKIYHYKRGY